MKDKIITVLFILANIATLVYLSVMTYWWIGIVMGVAVILEVLAFALWIRSIATKTKKN